jgi:phosphatidylinositol alpha-1,6-mannosyltransferase
MRILLVTNDYPPRVGGIQRYLKSLVAAFPGEVVVLAPCAPDGVLEPNVVRHERDYLWPTRSVARWIEAQVQRLRPDFVVFGAAIPTNLIGVEVRRATGVPYAVIVHGAELTVPVAVPGIGRLVANALRTADVVFTTSDYVTQRVSRSVDRPVVALGAGVDARLFSPGARTEFRTVGAVGRLVPRKGHGRTIRAVARLRDQGYDLRVLLIGSGRLESDLQRLARRLRVPTQFHQEVTDEELADLYRKMDCFSMPCRTRWLGTEVEGLGLVYLEAAASGLPILAGPSGGAPETVREGETGWVVETVSDVADRIRFLAEHPDWWQKMGTAARQDVLNRFQWEHAARRMASGLVTAGSSQSD